MLNHITIMGRLTREPELRYTQSQLPVASFTLAVDRDYSGRDGGEKQTDFINVVAWRSTAEFVSKYFHKGSMAVVSGRLQMRSYTDKNDSKRVAAEVVADSMYFGESKRDSANRAEGQGYSYTPPTRPAPSRGVDVPPEYEQTGFEEYEGDEELPF